MADKPQINPAHVQGEPGTGYEDPDGLGDFVCGNCDFFKANSCGQADMMARSKRPRTKDNRVEVQERGCCEYVKRVGRPAFGGKPKNLLKEPINKS